MSFDVAIVAAILAAQRICPVEELRRTVLLGELGLDGRLRPVRGILPATLAAQQAGFTRVIVPLRQAGEAELVEGIEVFGLPRSPNWLPFYKAFRCRLLSPSMWSVNRPASTRTVVSTWQMS